MPHVVEGVALVVLAPSLYIGHPTRRSLFVIALGGGYWWLQELLELLDVVEVAAAAHPGEAGVLFSLYWPETGASDL